MTVIVKYHTKHITEGLIHKTFDELIAYVNSDKVLTCCQDFQWVNQFAALKTSMIDSDGQILTFMHSNKINDWYHCLLANNQNPFIMHIAWWLIGQNCLPTDYSKSIYVCIILTSKVNPWKLH